MNREERRRVARKPVQAAQLGLTTNEAMDQYDRMERFWRDMGYAKRAKAAKIFRRRLKAGER